MVELRKRKTPPPAPARPAKKKAGAKPATTKAGKAKAAVAAKVEAVKEAVIGGANGAKKSAAPATGAPAVGDSIDLASFGGEVETHDGAKTTLAKLVEDSKAGVVLFIYPKASTPGCTTQACLFRDAHDLLTTNGFSIYGLSSDSPKSNTTFKTKQNLPYTLLCDPSATLIKAIGMQKNPKGIKRGVFVVDKAGKVLAAEPGGPQATVDAAKNAMDGQDASAADKEVKEKEDTELAQVASEVADTAAKIDGEKA